MANIGEPDRHIIKEPIEAPAVEPVTTPTPDREEVPA